MKSKYFLIFLIHLIFLFSTSISGVYSQSKRLQFKHLTPDDGLSSSITTSIFQDYKGFMWIGTYDGLNRYDGFNFIVFKNNPADSTSLADNFINTMIEDHDKNLLIGTTSGLSLYDRKNDRFFNYILDKSSPLSGKKCSVSSIAEDSMGNLWLGTNTGLIYFDRIKNLIVQYAHDSKNPESLSYNYVDAIKIDKSNRLWVATRAGLNLFLPETGTFQHIIKVENETTDLSDTFFTNIIEDRAGNLWFGSKDGLFCLKNNAENKITPLKLYQHNPHDKNSLSINQVNALYIDDKNNLWIGTENGGLNLFDKENQSFSHYRKDDYDPMSLNNESIEAIYNDRTGNMWIGTFTGGLNISMKNRDAIIHYQTLPGAPFSLSHNTVTCFLEDHNSQILVGTDGGGLNLFDKQTNRFLCYNIDNSRLSSNSILCMLEDSNNHTWLGTWSGGLVFFDNKTKSFKSYTTKNCGIQDDNIFAVTEGDHDDLWLGSFEHGLIHYQIKEKKFTSYTTENSGLISKMIIKIVKYSNGRLLVGSPNGFQIFSPGVNQFTTYLPDPKNINSLSDQKIVDILVENDSCVWIGTNNGLNRFNPNTESFVKYYEKDGLPGNVINGLSPDKSGALWVTTNKGVCRFNYREKEFKNFTKDDGLQCNEFSNRSILRTKSGALLMGGTKGFNIVYPEKIIENKSIPTILITDLKILNKRMEPGAKNSPLVQNITETKTLTLSYKQSVITFYFAVMDFTAPEKNQYAYKMEGFDNDWIYADNKREATYTNLNSGDYVLHVKGTNNDGTWNEKGVSLRIIIIPPWWKTLWFRSVLILAFLLSVFFVYYIRLQFYRDKQKELSILVEKRTHELTLANKELLERQILIEDQSEELRAHAENLKEANDLLVDNQSLIKLQTDFIQEANAELTKLNSTKDRILSIIGHDLRNPFNAISGFTEILLEEFRILPPETTETYLNYILNSSNNASTLLTNLLDWSRIQTGSITFDPVRQNLFLVTRETFNFIEGAALKKNIIIQLQIDPEVYVEADENMLKTILRNLLSNAIKFTCENGIIIISSSVTDCVEVSVSDSGVGIPEEKIPLLFNIDTNKSTKGTSRESGTGLGLILCKEFVEKHQGKIWVESQIGIGSQFKFTLPLSL